MKVMYVVSTLKRTGPTSQLLNIISNLGSNITPILVTLSPEVADSRFSDFQALGITVISLNLGRVAGVVQARKKLAQLIKLHNPDLLHTQGIRADNLASQFATILPAVCTVRNFPQLDYAMTYGKLLGKLMAISHFSTLKNVRQAVGVSAGVTNNLKKNNVSSAVTVRNGVDTTKFVPTEAAIRLALREKYGISDDAFVFVATGHLTARKNPLLLIHAFKQAFSVEKNCCLLLVGDGDQQATCIEAAADDARIILTGRVPAVNDYLAIADVYVSSSLAEGLPNAALEAMATDLPVILSDIPPHLELLGLGGDIGYNFAVNDINQLIQAMQRMSQQDLAVFKKNLRLLISQELSAACMSQNYQTLYKELAVS